MEAGWAVELTWMLVFDDDSESLLCLLPQQAKENRRRLT